MLQDLLHDLYLNTMMHIHSRQYRGFFIFHFLNNIQYMSCNLNARRKFTNHWFYKIIHKFRSWFCNRPIPTNYRCPWWILGSLQNRKSYSFCLSMCQYIVSVNLILILSILYTDLCPIPQRRLPCSLWILVEDQQTQFSHHWNRLQESGQNSRWQISNQVNRNTLPLKWTF